MLDHKPSIENQRIFNVPMQELQNKEIKWLDDRVIYPIADGSWLFHVQFDPKMDWITMVQNERNELVSMRAVTGWRFCMD